MNNLLLPHITATVVEYEKSSVSPATVADELIDSIAQLDSHILTRDVIEHFLSAMNEMNNAYNSNVVRYAALVLAELISMS